MFILFFPQVLQVLFLCNNLLTAQSAKEDTTIIFLNLHPTVPEFQEAFQDLKVL